MQCRVGNRTLTFTNQAADPAIRTFVTAAAAAGATGIGAATDYMGDRTIHVGFGTSENDQTRLTWGRGGSSANAPAWLRSAAMEGWDNPTGITQVEAHMAFPAGRYVVIARSGLRLRGGPGPEFEVERVLPLGTQLMLVAVDAGAAAWGRVDLEGDGLLDGYVHCGFIAPADTATNTEFAAEPDDGQNG